MRSYSTQALSLDTNAHPATDPVPITVDDRAATREVLFRLIRKKGIAVVERSGWNAKPPQGDMAPDWNYTMIAIHHAGRSFACWDGKLQVASIQDHHMGNRFTDIGYHFAIDCSGTVYEARDIRYKGSHLYNYNTAVIGIVLLEDLTTSEEGGDALAKVRTFMARLGAKTTNAIPEPQIAALSMLTETLKDLFRITHLGGHREFPMQLEAGKICPGNIGIELVQKLRENLKLSAPKADGA